MELKSLNIGKDNHVNGESLNLKVAEFEKAAFKYACEKPRAFFCLSLFSFALLFCPLLSSIELHNNGF
jgi:hypothetical protein